MKSILFTYYSNALQDIFLENVESLLNNSMTSYAEIAICSQIEVPVSILKSLSKYAKVNRFFPDHNSQKAKKNSNTERPYKINPFMLTGLSYRNCSITIFDPHLFIIKPIAEHLDCSVFYKDHHGSISTQFFTFRNDDAASQLLINSLSDCDFTDDLVRNKFAFVISNGVPFSNSIIYESAFIFSNPTDADLLLEEKLFALDLSETITSSKIHKQVWAVRSANLPKISTLTRLKNKTVSAVSAVINSSIQTLESASSKKENSKSIILFKYTSRSRPDQFYRGLVSIINNCSNPNYRILCSFDDNDPTLNKYLSYISDLSNSRITVSLGSSKNKIDAINRDLNNYSKRWDILVNMSDDMIFCQFGFDEVIREAFGSNLDQFIHFNDGNQKSNLCSMTIEGKPYYRRFNYIYHPSYISLWCDVEAQDVAKMLGLHKYMGDSTVLFKHLHPAFGLAQMDAQYVITDSQELWSADLATYTLRKNKNFVDSTKIEVAEPSPVLSILILSIHSRKDQFDSLLTEFKSQASEFDGDCEILYDIDNGEKTKGLKRNDLLDRATGKYVAFFDDDDWPSSDYVKSIMRAVESDPDCCSLLGEMTTDGKNPELFEHSLAYTEWKTSLTNSVKYERNPNHLNAIRSSIAKTIKFPEINFGEDHEWSKSLQSSGLLTSESKIPNVIYYYKYVTSK